MTMSHSDEWLLALVDEKSPEEFTTAELEVLRARASMSPEIRRAIVERVRLDESLYTMLAESSITAESIRRRVDARRRRSSAGIAVGAAALMFAVAAIAWWYSNLPEEKVAETIEIPRAAAASNGDAATDAPEPMPATEIGPVMAKRPRPPRTAVPVVATTPGDVASPMANDGPKWWESMLGDEARVVPFSESASASFGETMPGFEVADEFPASELNQWIVAVPRRPFAINEGRWKGQRFAGLEGTGKLLPNWRSDAVLRIAPFDIAEFALHFWSGTTGVTIRFYPHQRPKLLAAYEVTRNGDEPSREVSRLIATDGGRYARSNGGAIEIRHQDGLLVVTRGALPLLIVPRAEMPSEILLEGRMRLRDLAMYRGEPAFLPEGRPHHDLFAGAPIDQLEWVASDNPAPDINTTPGKITLSWSGPKPEGPRKVAWSAIRLPPNAPSGLCEAVFRIDSLTPGTGIYLGDAEGRPVHCMFASEASTARAPVLSFGWSNRNGTVPEPRWTWNVDPKKELAPAVGAGTWIKLVVGRGGLKTFISGDGRHWGLAALKPERNVRGPMQSIGIFTIADDKTRKITVSAVTVRELSDLATMADLGVRSRVPEFGDVAPERTADWISWATATRPDSVSEGNWLRACGVETLARGAADEIADSILNGLAREAIESNDPIADKLATLHDIALLSDQWSDRSTTFEGYYQQLARHLIDRREKAGKHAQDLQLVVEASLSAPVWAENGSHAIPPAAVRNLAAVAAWAATVDPTSAEAARSAAQRVAASFLPAHPERDWTTNEEAGLARLASWSAESTTASATSTRASVRFAWQHPLVTEPGREGQTLASELESALTAAAYEDTARLMSTISGLQGLVPALMDGDRFVTPAGLISEVAAHHPRLITTLAEQFGPAGLLHVRQSIANGDERAVEEAAIRFFGTPAAAEARRWLGERALAAGRFTESEKHFAAALLAAPENEQSDLTAYQRLSAALAGHQAVDASTVPVTFGSRTMSAEAFEKLLDDLRQSRGDDSTSQSVVEREIPNATAVAFQSRGRIEGDVGRNPGRHQDRRYDWASRQISVVLARETAYLTNRFQVIAFDLAQKSVAWSVGLGSEQGDTHALPNVAFRPIVENDRLYVRRLLGRGPELASLSLADRGKVLWRSESRLAFASDPILDGDQLVAVTCASTARSGGPFTLALTRLRSDDGTEVASTPLIVLNDAGDAKPSAQMILLDNGFLISTTGTVLRCDATGSLVWVRRLPYLPEKVDVDAGQLPPEAPLLIDDRVIVAPPGSRAAVCLDARTGRMLWVRPLGELERLVGLSGGVLVFRLTDALAGFDPNSGETKWKFVRENLLDGMVSDAKSLLVSARTTLKDRRDGLSLLHIDTQTGRLNSEQIVRVDRKEEVRFGPMFIHDGTLWGFQGDGWRDPNRTLVEFVPDTAMPAVGPSSHPGSLRNWLPHVEPQSRLNVITVLPGWMMTGSPAGPEATFRDEYRGEHGVLFTQAGRDRAIRFVRSVEIKPGQKLTAHVGRDDDEGWTLRLLADGKPLASQSVNEQTAPDGWRTAVFDLSPLAGRKVMLALDQAPPADDAGRTTKAYWKHVAIE